MLSLNEYSSLAGKIMADLVLPQQPEGLYAPVRYTLDGGGKRLRPVLVLASADAFGADRDAAVMQAAGIEMFHNFTLLHDDVMDRADVRRNRPTVHRKWNEATAILSGDAMLTLASIIITRNCDDTRFRAVSDLFNRTAMEIYEGQQLDMDFESRTDVTISEYMEMIRLKTSVLLGCAAALGAIMSGASDKSVNAIYAYGEKLGLAFQLRDDYLDTYGSAETFGKKIGGDIRNDKKTWLLINALAEDTSGEISRQLSEPTPDKFERVRGVYDALNLPARCLSLIERYATDAIGELDAAGLSDAAVEFFTSLAMKTVNRTH
ncbi:MAG: polyprenyl synthetase family protein [Paramuribaculum sp.]|nr:polyprenyl synthetase family protein [Paramuribaculum sp.]